MDTVAIAAVVVATLYGLHRFCLFAESRCWIYYRTRPPRIATLGLFEEVFEPKVEHLVEERAAEAIRAEQDESGEGSPHPDRERLATVTQDDAR